MIKVSSQGAPVSTSQIATLQHDIGACMEPEEPQSAWVLEHVLRFSVPMVILRRSEQPVGMDPAGANV